MTTNKTTTVETIMKFTGLVAGIVSVFLIGINLYYAVSLGRWSNAMSALVLSISLAALIVSYSVYRQRVQP